MYGMGQSLNYHHLFTAIPTYSIRYTALEQKSLKLEFNHLRSRLHVCICLYTMLYCLLEIYLRFDLRFGCIVQHICFQLTVVNLIRLSRWITMLCLD